MKNKHLSITFIGAVMCLVCSCNANKSTGTPEMKQTDSVDTGTPEMMQTDSVVCLKKAANDIECKIVVDYPSNDDSLAHSVAKYISGELGRQYLPIMNSIDDTHKYQTYKGALADGNAMTEYYTNGTLEYLKEQAKEMKDADMDEMPAMTYELAVRKTADNDRYVSYRTTSYAFLGGAHGSATDYTVNIAKQTGTVIAQTVDTLQAKAMQPILRKGVLSYLREQGDTEVTDKTLGDYLFIENNTIPLPAHTPYMAEDGIHFIYQQYEIGPYAMGMVAFTVPYDEIRPYLTREAAALTK